jgi:hypothetical protein
VLREVSGSENREFTEVLVQSVVDSLWLPPGGATTGPEIHPKLVAALAAVRAFRPRDEAEGMMAAQAVALHQGAMECLRRAMLPAQAPEAERLHRQAAGLTRAMAELVRALDRRRGGARQTIRVERVVVEAGGQAIVGAVAAPPAAGAARGVDGGDGG